jgi:hypothetical protein
VDSSRVRSACPKSEGLVLTQVDLQIRLQICSYEASETEKKKFC